MNPATLLQSTVNSLIDLLYRNGRQNPQFSGDHNNTINIYSRKSWLSFCAKIAHAQQFFTSVVAWEVRHIQVSQ
jgi:hypothetical protein